MIISDIGLIFIVLFLGLRYLIPSYVNSESLSLSKAKFKKIYRLTYLFWIISGIGISAAIYSYLIIVDSYSMQGFKYDLYPDKSFWIGTSILTGFSLSIIAVFGMIKLILKNESKDFWALYNEMYKFKALLILKGIIIIFSILGVTLIGLGKNSHFKISHEKIKISRLFDFSSKEYSITYISEINHILTYIAPNGNKLNKPYYEIVFNDGYRWNSKIDFREAKESDDKFFLEISNLSGVEIKEIN